MGAIALWYQGNVQCDLTRCRQYTQRRKRQFACLRGMSDLGSLAFPSSAAEAAVPSSAAEASRMAKLSEASVSAD